MDIIKFIEHKFQLAISNLFPTVGDVTAEVTQATQIKFGHYQCNSAMKLAKLLNKPSRAIAESIVQSLQTMPDITSTVLWHEKIEIAGPGFINITLSTQFIENLINDLLQHGPTLAPSKKEKVIIDFSSPNIAKELHVGHLRSTIIGDALARILEFAGHDVLRLNHIGDWGTQFGMLIAYLKAENIIIEPQKTTANELLKWYQAAKLCFDANADFKKSAYLEVVKLQEKNTASIKTWEEICTISRKEFLEIYRLLDINIMERGESFYSDMLPNVIADLEKANILTTSLGAKCVFLPGYTGRDDTPLPLIVQKSDGGFNYATTDLAALKHRVQTENGSWLIYVTDAGQSLHLNMIFKAAELLQYYDPKQVKISHVPFGLVLKEDGKKFKTRSGDTERLIDLIHAAIAKANSTSANRALNNTDANINTNIGETLGVNAIKYADLINNRVNDYIFSYDKMLQFEGKTAVFLAYAYVRIQSIKRKIKKSINNLIKQTRITLLHQQEITLALKLCQFPETISMTIAHLMPHRLAEYLYNLAEIFNGFFHQCHVEHSEFEDSRLLLCEATSQIMQLGMNLLGLKTIEAM